MGRLNELLHLIKLWLLQGVFNQKYNIPIILYYVINRLRIKHCYHNSINVKLSIINSIWVYIV